MKKETAFRLRLIFSVCIVILLVFALISRVAAYTISFFIQDEVYSHYTLLADVTSQKITTWFQREVQILATQKASVEITGNLTHEYLTEYLTEIVRNYNEEGYIYDLYFVSTDNVMSSGYGYIPDPSIDFTQRDWYQGALSEKEQFVSSPYKDTNLDKFVVTISASVHDKNGELKGVLALDIFVDTLFQIIEEQDVPKNSYVFLLDSNFGIVTHPNSQYQYVNEAPINITDPGHHIYQDLPEKILNQERAVFHITDYDGAEREMFVSRIEHSNWYVAAAISEDLIHESEKMLLFSTFAALILCLAVGILVTFAATRQVVAQLSSATEAAKSANETKSSFLANMSHEIRTPINAVIGMNEMIPRERTESSVREYALEISSASRSLISIVNDILDFSKIESGKLEIIENEFNIASVLNDIVNMSMSRLGDKDLTLFVNVDPTIPCGILGDELRIKQIILNLMTNGIKYTNEGHVMLRISYTRQNYGLNLNVSVSDTGIGISPENLEKLFDSFQQVDTKRNRKVEGTGLGLSITKQLVQNMGGFINVSSTYGVGSEFKFTIPLKVVSNAPFLTIRNPESIRAWHAADLSFLPQKTEQQCRELLTEMSGQLGIELKETADIEELKTAAHNGEATHIFADVYFYQKHQEDFEALSKEITIAVIHDRNSAIDVSGNIRSLNIPFYAMPASVVLNNEISSAALNEYRSSIIGFTAPKQKFSLLMTIWSISRSLSAF